MYEQIRVSVWLGMGTAVTYMDVHVNSNSRSVEFLHTKAYASMANLHAGFLRADFF